MVLSILFEGVAILRGDRSNACLDIAVVVCR